MRVTRQLDVCGLTALSHKRCLWWTQDDRCAMRMRQQEQASASRRVCITSELEMISEFSRISCIITKFEIDNISNRSRFNLRTSSV